MIERRCPPNVVRYSESAELYRDFPPESDYDNPFRRDYNYQTYRVWIEFQDGSGGSYRFRDIRTSGQYV